MRRREFVKTIAGLAAWWPLSVRAQQSTMPVVGFLSSASPKAYEHFVAAFKNGLAEAGYVEGKNVSIDYRWAEDQYDRLPALAAELVRRQVSVIVASGGPVPARAAKAATSTIPIVFTALSDPVRLGLVASFNKPGSNVTGVAALTSELDAKRLEILRELVPNAETIGALVNSNRQAEGQVEGIQAAGRAAGRQLVIVSVGNENDFVGAFETLHRRKVGALVVGASAFFTESPRSSYRTGSALLDTRDISVPRFRHGRRSRELWCQWCRRISERRAVHGQNSSRGEAGQFTCYSAHKV